MCLQNCGNTLIAQDHYAYPEGKHNVTSSYLKLIMHECFTKLGVVVSGIESEPEPFTPSAREQPPAIARPITNTLVVEGSPAKFVAEYTGEPTPQVTWLRNALQILQETRDIKVIGGCF